MTLQIIFGEIKKGFILTFIKMTKRNSIYKLLHLELENVGFEFETEQKPYFQNRQDLELRFSHPLLIERLKEDGYSVRAKKFYIKPLSDEEDSEIGFVTCLLYTSPSPRDATLSRMPSSA